MNKLKLHKRQIFYLSLYVILSALTLAFFIAIFFTDNAVVQSFMGIMFILWLPIVFATVLSGLPQSIAGNLFIYKCMKNKEKRDYKVQTYSSDNFLSSEFYSKLMEDESYSKIKSVSVDRQTPKSKTEQYFIVRLKDASKYRVTIMKRDKQMQRYTTRWVVDSIEEVK